MFKMKPLSSVVSTLCATALLATPAVADQMPPEKSLAGLSYELIGRDDLWTYKSLAKYN